MRTVATAAQYRANARDRHYDQAARTVLALAGALLSIVGVLLAIGGYLSPINGSAFQMLAGFGLIVSGALISRRHRAGVWTYMLVFAGTLSWSLSNLGVGSTVALRLVGPALLLAMIAVLMPILYRWRPLHTIAVFTALVAGTAGLAVLSLPNGPLASHASAVTQFIDAGTKGLLR